MESKRNEAIPHSKQTILKTKPLLIEIIISVFILICSALFYLLYHIKIGVNVPENITGNFKITR